jgi:RHS repeat-associated protein
VKEYYDYEPFGKTLRENIAGEEKAVYKFTGKELDDEGGLNWYYFGARYYDPAIGRWMGVDWMTSLSKDISPYCYCHNNPLKYTDSDGNLDPVQIQNALLYFSASHPEAAKEIGEVFEFGISFGGQIGVQGEMGPFKGEISAQLGGEGTSNLAGSIDSKIEFKGTAKVEVAGLVEAGGKINATLDDGKIKKGGEWKCGPKDFELKKDLKVGGTLKAIAVGVQIKINLGEAIDATVKGINELQKNKKIFDESLNRVIKKDKKEDKIHEKEQ